MKALFAIIFISINIAGCSSAQLKNDSEFSTESKKGLVSIGIKGSKDFNLYFAKYDAENRKLNTKAEVINKSLTHEGSNSLRYHLMSLEPGEYVLKSISHLNYSSNADFMLSGADYTNNILCLNRRTYRFEVKPGEIQYLGDIEFETERNKLLKKEGNFSGAREALSAYPNVLAKINNVGLKPASFENSRTAYGRNGECGG